MKKEIKKSILFYAASALLYMAFISFKSMAVVWLCHHFFALARRKVCLKKKGNDKTDASNK